jgi:SNF2 family DNA or RNA helicase
MAKINTRIKPMTFRADDPEVQALLPELILNSIPVELPAGIRGAYNTLEKTFFLELGDAGNVMPPTAAALSQKLRQLCNGTLYVAEDGQNRAVDCHDLKLDALDSVVGEAGGKPLLVFYEFIADRERICARYHAPHIGGDTTPLEAAKLVAEFNAGKHKMLCVHPRSAGFGLNLQEACSEAVWFGPTWDCGVYEQAVARIYRQGQANKHVTIHTLVVADSIEERVQQALMGKATSQRELLDALRR